MLYWRVRHFSRRKSCARGVGALRALTCMYHVSERQGCFFQLCDSPRSIKVQALDGHACLKICERVLLRHWLMRRGHRHGQWRCRHCGERLARHLDRLARTHQIRFPCICCVGISSLPKPISSSISSSSSTPLSNCGWLRMSPTSLTSFIFSSRSAIMSSTSPTSPISATCRANAWLAFRCDSMIVLFISDFSKAKMVWSRFKICPSSWLNCCSYIFFFLRWLRASFFLRGLVFISCANRWAFLVSVSILASNTACFFLSISCVFFMFIIVSFAVGPLAAGAH